MRTQKIIYVLLSMIVFSSSLESSTEKTENSNNKRIQTRDGDERPVRQRKQQQQEVEKVTVPEDDEEKKTLAQQVLDGKYGLIQTELFSSPVKRPGIISYEVNPEVPKDNINNLGGLKPEEIWLAENHLLVLKGGGFSEKEQTGKVIWPPIDNYIAPQRQVKIPPNPKVPPPFPIQLKEGGPIEVIPSNNTKPPPYFNGPFGPPFLFPLTPNIPKGSNEEESKQVQGNFTQGNGGGVPFPFLPPGIGLYPPAIAFLPPPGNLTELDEDDPRIYYPPKYDFVYKKNYTSHVPPGPLVPGIILPPPPNFFAPLENSTKSQRVSGSNKPATSLKKLSKTRLPLMNTERPKTHSRINHKPKGANIVRQQKLMSPIRVVNNNNHYEQSYKMKQNVSKEEWVPIPAPRPFFITEINKLRALANSKINDQSLKFEGPKNGWDFDSSTQSEIPPKVRDDYQINTFVGTNNQGINKEIYYTTERNEDNLISSTPTEKVVPIYDPVTPSSLITEEKQKYSLNNRNPLHPNGKLINAPPQEQPPARYVDQYSYNKPYEINTLIPQRVYGDVTIKTPSVSGRIRVPNIKYEEYKNTVKPQTSKPLSYLYYEQESKYETDDGGYSYEAPVNPVQIPYERDQYRALPVRGTAQQQLRPYSSTTQKPPVYEYSYSAPGYGTVEAPKVGNNVVTTPKPTVYEANFKPLKETQFTYFDYQSSKQNEYEQDQATVQPVYTTARTPTRPKSKLVKVDPYQTENPYLSYNTQELGLLDDITKKYFTLFGQKINQDDSRTITTTPVPDTNSNYYEKSYYKEFDNVAPIPTKAPSTPIRFPERYNIQNDKQYYQGNSEYSTPKYRLSNKKPKAHIQQPDNYPYYYSPESDAGLRGYKGYEQEVVRPNHPLASDIEVNYRQPRPPINPDAEFINPAYINPVSLNGNSYVSYRLPGNSGHFYFLTPQTLRQQNYPIQSPRLRYQIDNRGYIPRDIRNKVLE